ncbi:MAG: TRAP transporter large permease subunit [Rhizobiaceae bacterium]|nr:TRAP transporter large permease subunit [Rhizobiaceae bacterium]
MVDMFVLSTILILSLFVLLAGGLWVAVSLLAVGFIAMELATSAPVGRVIASTMWAKSADWPLVSLPLFIWMGEILFRTRLSEDMFRGLSPWLRRFPGRLIHVNVLGTGVFAAVSGSSAATAATIGKMALPELARRGYDEKLSIGSLAGSATLGLLIPPSIILIVYGVVAEVSIVRLFIAGILPGIVLIIMFMAYIMAYALIFPSSIPDDQEDMPFRKRISETLRLLPIFVLIIAVIGSIYGGIATATEAAAVGVVGSLAISMLSGTLTWKSFKESLIGATSTTCMISLILLCAAFLSVAMGFVGIPRSLAMWVDGLGLSPLMMLVILTIMFTVVGCFLDGISIVVLTAAILLPMVQSAGFDLIWFGIYIVVIVEMSQITPPVGFNLFVIQAVTGKSLFYIAYAALPFFLIMLAFLVVLVLFPELATYLPEQMTRR